MVNEHQQPHYVSPARSIVDVRLDGISCQHSEHQDRFCLQKGKCGKYINNYISRICVGKIPDQYDDNDPEPGGPAEGSNLSRRRWPVFNFQKNTIRIQKNKIKLVEK